MSRKKHALDEPRDGAGGAGEHGPSLFTPLVFTRVLRSGVSKMDFGSVRGTMSKVCHFKRKTG